MKKLILFAAAAILLCGSCKKSVPSASLKTDVDTISYQMGMMNSSGLKEYLSERLGVDTTYIDEFYKGLMESAYAGDDKKKAAYYAGVQIGQQIGTQMYKGINAQLFGEDSTQTISLRNFISGFVAGVEGKTIFNMDSTRQNFQKLLMDFQNKSKMKVYSANKEAGEKFLAENLKKEGVKEITPGGVQYKVLKEGNGPIPADTCFVMVNYEGRNIENKVFDSSYKNNDNKPVRVRVKDMIQGWVDVLTKMPVGSKWEVYVPQDKAYGSNEAGEEIKPFSTLIFTIELVSIVDEKDF